MILSGVVASSAAGVFIATGGNQVLTQNGWNYHLFTSSGTFTVASGASTLQVLTINGGAGGQTSYISGSIAYGGNGGAGGTAQFGSTNQPISTSFAVTVAGAGGTSSIVPATTMTTVNGGGGGGGGATIGGDYSVSVSANSTQGGSVALYNTRGVPWSLLSFAQAANSGGGGGASSMYDSGWSLVHSAAAQSTGGSSGYNSSISGPSGGDPNSAGGNAAPNSGGGGGGGGIYSTNYFRSVSGTARSGGIGGSGFVIVAYPVA